MVVRRVHGVGGLAGSAGNVFVNQLTRTALFAGTVQFPRNLHQEGFSRTVLNVNGQRIHDKGVITEF